MDKIHKIPLDQTELQSIRLHNKPWSIIYGVGISIVVIIIGALIMVFNAIDDLSVM